MEEEAEEEEEEVREEEEDELVRPHISSLTGGDSLSLGFI